MWELRQNQNGLVNEMAIVRCVECDRDVYRGDWEKHVKGKEHQLNTRANYVLDIMADFITLEELNEVVSRRGKDSKHGKLTGPLD